MVLPVTVPLIFGLPPEERSIVPLTCDPDCSQVRVNVPVKAPTYRPDQVPDRSADAFEAGALEVGAGVDGTTTAALVAVGVVGLELLHAEADTASAATTATVNMPDEGDRFDPRPRRWRLIGSPPARGGAVA